MAVVPVPMVPVGLGGASGDPKLEVYGADGVDGRSGGGS